MKKKILFVFLFIMLFCLTGCGKKAGSLVCSQKVSTVDVELTANFIGKKINAMSMKYDMDLSKYSDTLVNTLAAKDYCTTVQNSMSQFTLVGCNQSVKDKHLVVTSGIDIAKINSKELTGSPEATKESLEKQGYTCTLSY